MLAFDDAGAFLLLSASSNMLMLLLSQLQTGERVCSKVEIK